MANKEKILIVEDEILIADTLRHYVESYGYQVIGMTISYEEAIALYQLAQPDLVLIDIHLNGAKTGVDLANFIREQPQPVPFIYLTSLIDNRSIDQAKQTFPAAYLPKPIRPTSLYASIEIALHRHRYERSKEATITIRNGVKKVIVRANDILFLEADHIYINVYTRTYGRLMQRRSLSNMMADLPSPPFLQVHRSFGINLQAVTGWGRQQVFIEDHVIPVSRMRWKRVLNSVGGKGK